MSHVHRTSPSLLAALAAVLGLACQPAAETTAPSPAAAPPPAADPLAVGLATIRGDEIAAHVATLADDSFEGRYPGTAGEAKTVAYIAAAFARAGLEPGAGGSFLQPVALTSTSAAATSTLRLRPRKGAATRLPLGDGFIASANASAGSEIALRGAGLVFAGYGIVAPEHGWDDYAGVDVRGKAVVVLRGDPGPTRGDPSFFRGTTLTHHGTIKAKAKAAKERGAAAIFVLHDPGTSGVPWSILGDHATQAKMRLAGPSDGPNVGGALPLDVLESAVKAAGADLRAMIEDAATDSFRARELGIDLDLDLHLTHQPLVSHNVVGVLPGVRRPDEHVIYTAHWDHVGVRENAEGGDRIFNGAVDNATGTAALLELTEAYAALPERPARSIVFIATTAEEQGLLGAEAYVRAPLFPLAEAMAVINMDALFPFGEAAGMTVVGRGASELEDYLEEAATAHGRRLYADPQPELGAFFRSDHYPFAAKGVPAIFAVGGPALDDPQSVAALMPRFEDYVRNHYHQVSDEYDPATWDMAGIVDDVRIYFQSGLRIAEAEAIPNWRADSEFRPLRDAMREAAAGSGGRARAP